MNATRISIACVSLSIVIGLFAVAQQTDQNQPETKKSSTAPQRETIARPLSEREKKRREEKLRKELETPYRKWLNEDVAYIITDEERAAFKRLQTDEEREQFIEQFWLRRDPTPDTIETSSRKNTTAASPTPTSITLPASRAGRPTAGASTLPTGRPTKSSPTPPAAATSGLPRRAAARPPPSPSNSGATAGSKASAPTSLSSSSTPPCRANIT